MKKLKLNLCKNCIEDLKNYNPYVDKDGRPIMIEELDITEVSTEEYINYTDENGKFIHLPN